MPQDTSNEQPPPSDTKPIGPPTLTIDWDRYGKMLEASELSDAEKRAFIETLWSIAVSFADLGFGIHPLRLAAENTCEQQAKIAKFITQDPDSMVSSSDSSLTDFNAAADVPPSAARERPSK